MFAASRASVQLRADERSGSVAATSPMAKIPSVPGHPQVGVDPHEPVLVEQLRWQPLGVGTHPADRPQDGLGRRSAAGRCSTATGSAVMLVAGEAVGHDGAVPRVQADPGRAEPVAHLGPDPRVVLGERALAGEVQVDPLVGPGRREVGGAAHRGRAAADDDHRRRRRRAARGRPAGRRPPPGSTAGPAGARSRCVTPVEITSTSYGLRDRGPVGAARTATERPARSSPVSVPCTVRTRSRPRGTGRSEIR